MLDIPLSQFLVGWETREYKGLYHSVAGGRGYDCGHDGFGGSSCNGDPSFSPYCPLKAVIISIFCQ